MGEAATVRPPWDSGPASDLDVVPAQGRRLGRPRAWVGALSGSEARRRRERAAVRLSPL